MEKHIHVAAAVIVKQGKIFCAKRGEATTLAGMWEFPGGKIEKNETAVQALKREIVEELSCEIAVGKKITTTTYVYDFGTVHLTTYYSRILSGMPVLTEHTDAKWLTPSELLQLNWAPADLPTIHHIKKDMNGM